MSAPAKITKEKIINAVLTCSFDKSVGATSLADIAKKLGIKKASLYNHYENRDAIIEDTVRWCGDYLSRLVFIPNNLSAICQKYSAASVMKALISRWIKLNESEPVIQIYSFLESEKYFSNEAAKIVELNRVKFIRQTAVALATLARAKKIVIENSKKNSLLSEILSLFIREYLDNHIVQKKRIIRSNPETGEDTLFHGMTLPEPSIADANRLIEEFCSLLVPVKAPAKTQSAK